jgi:hypothetical protein
MHDVGLVRLSQGDGKSGRCRNSSGPCRRRAQALCDPAKILPVSL